MMHNRVIGLEIAFRNQPITSKGYNMTALNHASIASKVATNLLGEIALDESKTKLRDETNKLVKQLHEAKVTIGRRGNNGCPIASAFWSTLVDSKKVDAKTASNYLTTFKEHVKTGKPIVDWNLHRKTDAKGNAKGKGKSTLSNLLVKAFNHDEGKSFQNLCEKIEIQWNDAKVDSIYEGVKEYLKSEGFEIKD
jgi:hypothetical protein